MKPTVLIAALGVCVLAGLAIGWQVKPTPPPTYRNVIVTDTVITHEAPDTVLRFIDRIKWKVAEPTVIAHGDVVDTVRLAAYCRPDTVHDSIPVTPVLPPSSGKYDGKKLSLFSVTSDSKLFAQETNVSAPFEWVNRGGVYEVREQRAGFQLFRGIPKFALPFLAGIATGVILSK